MIESTQLEELISFDPQSRKIFLNDKRVVLMDADSLGTLRRDLIAALGIDRAKGFLLRYGWNCGENAAKTFRSFLPSGSEMDWMYAGPAIHEMTGNVAVELTNLKFNPDTKEYAAEGYWRHSYEAEQHITHFGIHHEPVCFTLSGFGGGYVSAHIGRKVIFREVECVGKGDPHCRWVAKPIEDWDDDIQSEVGYYEEENLAQELDRAYLRIEKQKEMLERALTINEELSKILLRQEGWLSIISILGKNLHTTVIIEDKEFRLVESTGVYREHELSRLLRHGGPYRALAVRLVEQKRTVRVSVPEEFGWRHERLMSPIIVNNEVVAYISLIKEEGDFEELELISLERASTSCAIQLLNERAVIEAEQRVKGQLLDELLTDGANLESLAYRIRRMGYDLTRPHYVFVFAMDQPPEKSTASRTRTGDVINPVAWDQHLSDIRKKLEGNLFSQIRNFGESTLVSSRLNHLVALVSLDMLDKLHIDAAAFGQMLTKNVFREFSNLRVRLGISSLCGGLADYRRGHEESKKALRFTGMKKDPPAIVQFDDLGFVARLSNGENTANLHQFADEILGKLLAYDKEHGTELLTTLHYFFEHQGNVLKTSRAMTMSAGSIKYRLRRAEEITGLDLSQSKDFFDAYLALDTLMFLGEVEL
ncbi:XylR N-terminal domain-containing protein [Alicyclobacillus cycloheptanicus]|uniref:Sugar diacid utilization regulator n=1 Tax=Alicyclobacillus cycloheptanicus TaxID=1457 RepID=A0ABT9XMI4_9BACL|nr:XylR N-terminal domain-containing protein [Alicyclobacillus cycloheptanicus]MDQ0191512.1 sugar diacid utilization regulator [Alicyclobacillus cycloheptanicus]WDM00148.1 XylR N-terminal domain-containing protein [Alicyclobacillus cycloheptanicus]